MKKLLFTTAALALLALAASAQTYKTRDGNIYFNPNKDQNNKEYSALSKEATAVLKVETSEVALLVPMKTFHFNNALLEEHFNENYLHTNKYPNGTYKGKLIGFDKGMLAKDGEYKLTSEGKVEMHGVTKDFKAPVVLTVKGKSASFKCNFTITAEDHNIEIPGLVKPKLADKTPLVATIIFKMD
jgi:polyisoprenoid-binding protein YceI